MFSEEEAEAAVARWVPPKNQHKRFSWTGMLLGLGIGAGIGGVVGWLFLRGRNRARLLVEPGVYEVQLDQLVELRTVPGASWGPVGFEWRPEGHADPHAAVMGDDVLWTVSGNKLDLQLALRTPGILRVEQMIDDAAAARWVLHTPGEQPAQ